MKKIMSLFFCAQTTQTVGFCKLCGIPVNINKNLDNFPYVRILNCINDVILSFSKIEDLPDIIFWIL